MAGFSISLDSLKRMYHSQVHDPDKWATNMRVLRAAGMFLGSIVVMRNFGDYLVGEGA